ncbi:TPA: TGS domain-containing protein, partial [Candidatus Woesearchaeota archaeon]|nr:TGS domain-containing protein [Candidatus Woesearchaeota archaeon]
MSKIKITFPDNDSKEYDQGVTGFEVAKGISEGLAREACAIKVNDKVQDLSLPINEDSKVQILTFKDKEGKEVFWHSSAHLMAHAITELYPYAKLTIGPVVDEGFYYDMEHDPFTPEDLKKIEQKMYEIMKQKEPIVREMVSKQKALELFKDNEFKVEMIKELEEGSISIYRQGSFVDLCRGPHVPDTGLIKAFKLTKIAGAYWRGDEKNKQLQRIYATAFTDKKELKQHLHRLEEAKKRDHRKLGRELDLFSFNEEAGAGL